MTESQKAGISKVASITKLIFIVGATAVISAGAMLTYWLHVTNDQLEDQKGMLEVRIQELQSIREQVEANNLYLKEQALKENVFLTDRPTDVR